MTNAVVQQLSDILDLVEHAKSEHVCEDVEQLEIYHDRLVDCVRTLVAVLLPEFRDSDGTRSAETACPAPAPKGCQARVRKDIAQ